MIGTVTLNLALDVTYEVDGLQVGGSHRVERIRRRAGGKGVNVARVAATLGHQVLVLGFVGGVTGELVAEELFDAGLTALLTPIAGETRRTVAIVNGVDGDATIFNESGPSVTSDEWRAFLDRMPWGRMGVLACSGSLPPGLPSDAYAELAVRARHHDVLSVIDTGGDALTAAGPAGAGGGGEAVPLGGGRCGAGGGEWARLACWRWWWGGGGGGVGAGRAGCIRCGHHRRPARNGCRQQERRLAGAAGRDCRRESDRRGRCVYCGRRGSCRGITRARL